MTEREQLEAAIAANPADDDARLAFADWIQEQDAKYKTCDRCNGKKWRMWRSRTAEMNSDEFCESSGPCECGSRTVLDTSDRDRSEFIRLQIEFERSGKTSEHIHGLITAHSEWKSHKCPECGGSGWRTWAVALEDGGSVDEECPHCIGSGDLLSTMLHGGVNREDYPVSRNPQFTRGFIDSVECTLAEIGEEKEIPCPECNGSGSHRTEPWSCPECSSRCVVRRFIPSSWSVAVVRALPVTRFRIRDKSPMENPWLVTNGISYRWMRDSDSPSSLMVYSIPSWLWNDELKGPYRSPEDANQLLATVVCDLVRQSVYPTAQTQKA